MPHPLVSLIFQRRIDASELLHLLARRSLLYSGRRQRKNMDALILLIADEWLLGLGLVADHNDTRLIDPLNALSVAVHHLRRRQHTHDQHAIALTGGLAPWSPRSQFPTNNIPRSRGSWAS